MLAIAACATALGQSGLPLIVDTDAGADDLIAILWLLRRPEVRIEAITVVDGLAPLDAGCETILRLIETAQRSRIPVYRGSLKPGQGGEGFPAPWRRAAATLMHASSAPPRIKVQPETAGRFLARRLADTRRPIRVLALGPLTNFASALANEPMTGTGLKDFVWMGGALDVPGNVPQSPKAEWNAWLDPVAADRVLGGTWRVRVVPLDATNKVEIDQKLVESIERTATRLDSRLVAGWLRASIEAMKPTPYYAWDPLAAMALVIPSIVTLDAVALAVRKRSPERGRLVELPGIRQTAWVARSADAAAFRRYFRIFAE